MCLKINCKSSSWKEHSTTGIPSHCHYASKQENNLEIRNRMVKRIDTLFALTVLLEFLEEKP